MRKLFFIILYFGCFSLFSQEKSDRIKLSLGTSFFNVNENFDDLFLFNNASPVFLGFQKGNFRVETIGTISILESEINAEATIRGSVRLTLDYISKISSKMNVYFGPQYGYNSNRTHLCNLHIGGEYFLHDNWSISNQVGLNILFDNKKSFQTNSSIILRFYLGL